MIYSPPAKHQSRHNDLFSSMHLCSLIVVYTHACGVLLPSYWKVTPFTYWTGMHTTAFLIKFLQMCVHVIFLWLDIIESPFWGQKKGEKIVIINLMPLATLSEKTWLWLKLWQPQCRALTGQFGLFLFQLFIHGKKNSKHVLRWIPICFISTVYHIKSALNCPMLYSKYCSILDGSMTVAKILQ